MTHVDLWVLIQLNQYLAGHGFCRVYRPVGIVYDITCLHDDYAGGVMTRENFTAARIEAYAAPGRKAAKHRLGCEVTRMKTLIGRGNDPRKMRAEQQVVYEAKRREEKRNAVMRNGQLPREALR